ncbi:MAG: multiheme c-type cytochrome [Allosphingosinicella sp.]
MVASRSLAIGALAASLLLALAVFLSPAIAQQNAPAHYVGVASCAGSTCHGRSEANGAIVRQDELRLWQDPSSPAGAHSRAWQVLTEPRAKAIAARLGIGEAASAPMCLGCHATPGTRTSDGVGCESCHGAASGWLASHYAVGGTHAANVARGLVPLDNPQARASRCLDCHFGSGDSNQFVDHRMMAAGHPRISFELDLFSTLQQHHNEDGDYVQRKGRSNGVTTWAVGQAMALERSLTLFATPGRGTEGMFPEFYFFDCHSCHRRISDDPRFEPGAEANPGRPIPAGMPPYNDENMIMLAAAARVAAPQLAPRFERDSRAFHAALAKDRASAVAAAAKLRESAHAVAADLVKGVSRAQLFDIVDTIAGTAVAPRFTDYAGSVQAVMGVDTLLSALVSSGEVSAAQAQGIRGDINLAYRAVADPNSYNPREFRSSLGRAAAAIRKLK